MKNTFLLLGLFITLSSCDQASKREPETTPTQTKRNRASTKSVLSVDMEEAVGSGAAKPTPAIPYGNDKIEKDISAMLASYSGDELNSKLSDYILKIPRENWFELLQIVSVIPPGEYVSHAFGTAKYRLVHEHPELWPNYAHELNRFLIDSQMDSLALDYGSELGK